MRVCFVGQFYENLDEGARNVGKCLVKEFKNGKKIETMSIYVNNVLNSDKIKKFNPDIIHFILAPTWKGLLVCKITSILNHNSKIIISAVHPAVPDFKLLKFLRPDLVLIQSKNSEKIFESLKFRTLFLPNGVDTDRFIEKDEETKNKLRRQYNIPTDKFVILHLASFQRKRNLDIFKELQKDEENMVLLIGRENENADLELIDELKNAGCNVWIKHFPKIEDIYNISDCYLFPTLEKKACIETPLSVLEGMSCNLPVITTKFGSLPELFEPKNGLFFYEDEREVFEYINNLKNEDIFIDNREKVSQYSWNSLYHNLIEIYDDLLK